MTDFDELYAKANTKVYRMAFYVLRRSAEIANPQDAAEDISQRAWLAASKLIQEGVDISEAFVIVAAQNAARAYRRDVQRRSKVVTCSTDDVISGPDGGTTRGDLIAGAASPPQTDPRISAIRIALGQLPLTLQLPMIMAYVDGVPAPEIAKELCVSTATVWKRLQRGRTAIKEIMTGNRIDLAA